MLISRAIARATVDSVFQVPTTLDIPAQEPPSTPGLPQALAAGRLACRRASIPCHASGFRA